MNNEKEGLGVKQDRCNEWDDAGIRALQVLSWLQLSTSRVRSIQRTRHVLFIITNLSHRKTKG